MLSNALKFSPPKSTITIIVSQFRDKHNECLTPNTRHVPAVAEVKEQMSSYLRVEVEDHGVGLHEHEVERLFNEMVQFDPGKLQGGGGSGIGLYLSKGIMDLHHGRIGVGYMRYLRLTRLERFPSLAIGSELGRKGLHVLY